MIPLSTIQVLAVLPGFGSSGCCQAGHHRVTEVASTGRVHHRYVDIDEFSSKGDADVGVLVVSTVQLKPGLKPCLSSSSANFAGKHLSDVIMAADCLGASSGVS